MSRVVAIAIAGVLLGGCGGSDGSGKDAASVSSSTTKPEAATPATRTDVADLGEVVITDAPSPYVPAPADVPSGSFKLESYLDNFSTTEDEDRKMLAACGFTRGFSRAWFDQNTGRVLAIFVFECSSEGAASGLRDAMEEQARRLNAATAFESPTVAGGRGQSYLEDIDDGQPESMSCRLSAVRASTSTRFSRSRQKVTETSPLNWPRWGPPSPADGAAA